MKKLECVRGHVSHYLEGTVPQVSVALKTWTVPEARGLRQRWRGRGSGGGCPAPVSAWPAAHASSPPAGARPRGSASAQPPNRASIIPVLRIRDILIQIRIRGSIPLTNRSWFGSCYFRQWPSRWQLKIIFLKFFFAYYFLKVHLHHFAKIQSKDIKKSENSRNQSFPYYFSL